MSSEKQPRQIWVKLEGVLAASGDVPSTWAIGPALPQAEAVLKYARAQADEVWVYGFALLSPRGQRRVQRWLFASGLSFYVYWTSHEQTPPAGVKVIDKWPLESTPTTDTLNGSLPAGLLPNASLKSPSEIKN